MPTLSQRLKNLLFAIGVIITDYCLPTILFFLISSFIRRSDHISILGSLLVLISSFWVAKRIKVPLTIGFWIFMGAILLNKLYYALLTDPSIYRSFPPTGLIGLVISYLPFIAIFLFLILAFKTSLTEVSFEEGSNNVDAQSDSKESSVSKLEPEIQDIVEKIRNRPFPGEHQF